MDPPTMINGGGGAFPGPNPAPYSMAEIWPFPVASGGQSGGLLGLRSPQFGQSGISHFISSTASNHEPAGIDPATVEPAANHGSSGPRKRRDLEDESTKGVSTSNDDSLNDCDGKRLKMSKDDNGDAGKAEIEPSSGKPSEQNKQPPEPPKQDYIHVRARRGQATDSHSLAERARREKISERMKILQDLVPGCNKVIGKALVLDEIINYIQSLQRQVEFLSMKLEAVNSRLNPGIEVFPPKDFGLQTFDAGGMTFASQAPREYPRSSSPEWLHMQVGGGFERRT